MSVRVWILVVTILLSVARSDYLEMAALTRRNTAVLDDKLFNDYVVGRNRDYDAAILFSYTKDKSACLSCAKTMDAFVRTALRWKDMETKERRLIFVVITMDEDPDLFDVFGLETFPSIVYLPEQHSLSEIEEEDRALLLLEKEDMVMTEMEIRHFITRNTDVEFVEDSDSLLTILVVVMACFLLLLMGYTYLFNSEFFYSFLGDSSRWYRICRFLMLVVVTGIFYDMLRRAPLLSTRADGSVAIFAVRGATILEGMIYGGLVTVIASQFEKLLSLEKKESEESVDDQINMNLAIISGCVMMMVLCFGMKNPWYFRGIFGL